MRRGACAVKYVAQRYSREVGQSELAAEALRINGRYLLEVVEAFDLCPWASSVRDGSGLKREVLHARRDGDEFRSEVCARIEALAADPKVDIGLLIFPNLEISSPDFRALLAAMESAHARAHARDRVPLAMANFHPDAELDMSTPARLVPFIRRSPDPTIQLVRRSTMDNVRQSTGEGSIFAESLAALMPLTGARPKPSVADSIARKNLRTVQREGKFAIEAILQDIASDRRTAYERASQQR